MVEGTTYTHPGIYTVTPTMGGEAGLCATGPHPWEERLGYAQQDPSNHGRRDRTMRNRILTMGGETGLCAEAPSLLLREAGLCAEAPSLLLRKAGLYAQRLLLS